MKLVFCLVVTLLLFHGGSACTCSPIDYADEYCNKENTIIAMVTISPEVEREKRWQTGSMTARTDDCVTFSPSGDSTTATSTTTYPSSGSPEKWVTVEAKIRNVYKGDRSVKGKKIFLKSSNGMCGIDYMLKPGKFILGFDANKDDVEGKHVSVELCSFFKTESHFMYRIGSLSPKKYFRRAKRKC